MLTTVLIQLVYLLNMKRIKNTRGINYETVSFLVELYLFWLLKYECTTLAEISYHIFIIIP